MTQERRQNKTLCPACKTEDVCFCGLTSDGKGGYKNKYECLNKETDCPDFTTEILPAQKEMFNGG